MKTCVYTVTCTEALGYKHKTSTLLHYYNRHFSFSEVYLIYTTFWELAVSHLQVICCHIDIPLHLNTVLMKTAELNSNPLYTKLVIKSLGIVNM